MEGLKRREIDLTALFKRLYEDNALGKIPNKVFRKLSNDYLLEQKEIQSSIPKREERLEKLKDSVANVGAFLEKARQYTKLDTLTAEILNLFIAHVEVGERKERYSRTAPQSIDIYYRDIGLLDNIVEAEPVTEQAATPKEVT